jgi:hypothetical protein
LEAHEFIARSVKKLCLAADVLVEGFASVTNDDEATLDLPERTAWVNEPSTHSLAPRPSPADYRFSPA